MTTNDRPAIINDRYELSRRIGRGGMADVFLGRDRLLDRQVAIKVLFPEFAVDPNFVERFRREAQAAANLSHPNIVNVYDWGKHAGTYFIAMEYVHGRTLAEILRTYGHVTSKQAAEIASEVAAALGFAHEAGLVHRDVKPANILIGTNGQVKVADFGIARAVNAPTESNLTQAGAVMGTATYFSPEQAQGAQPDPRSDLYSLGIVMYEMVAGKPPFTGDNAVSIAYKQVHDRPQPLNQIVADIPRAYEAIVAKLLAKDPAMRYASAEALRDDLRRFRSGDQVLALASAAAGRNPVTAPTAVLTRDAAPTVALAAAAGPRTATRPVTPARPVGYYDEPPPSRTGWYALAAFFALVALGIGGLLLFNALSGDDAAGSRALADYRNRPLAEVIAELDELGLRAEPRAEINTTVGENVVFRTDPVAGTVVVANQNIKVFYNPSPELQEVPDVEGLPLEEAQQALAAAGFRIGQTQPQVSDTVPDGSVIRSEPAAGARVAQDTLINLVISSGPDQLAVPARVVGLPEEEARNLLSSSPYEFNVSTTQQESDSVAQGLVIATDPGAGELLDVGGSIVLVVSVGAPGIEVPDVVGASEQAARDELFQFDVEVSYEELDPGDDEDGLVIRQSISPGERAPEGTTIQLVVGRALDPPPPTEEPDPPDPPETDPPATDPPETTAAATTVASAAPGTTTA